MNTVWSKHIQGINTLYYTRKLRFDDMFCAQYKNLFCLPEDRPLKILEIGCGPGALAGALLRWYPNADITGIDRDSGFIGFAKEKEQGAAFLEGDAEALPFADHTFDVTISNTVAEHIAPEKFYAEQMRVLKPNGVCLVLLARRGITVTAPCLAITEVEKEFWEKAGKIDDTLEKYAVCKYPMTESELPAAMEAFGFCDVSTGYVTVDLTPDNPKISRKLAHEMINAERESDLDSIKNVAYTYPGYFQDTEINEMINITNHKYDIRLHQYDSGKKYWDANVSVTMVIRGTKHPV